MKGDIPTIGNYQKANYDPKAAFSTAVRICQMELANIQNYFLSDLVLHYALHKDWETDTFWEPTERYVNLAKGLRELYEEMLG